ncbi:MAG: PilZ domain-containing protein [Spirochaetaceae bacterium]|jgi:hypothetical protein|nr:PilZ domain-containing protein [Spirochaetaceae bacterium]
MSIAAIIISILLASTAAIGIFTVKKSKSGENKVSWAQFYAKGSEAGFSNANIRLLKRLAQYSGMKYPAALFWSQKQMDDCIKNFIHDIKHEKTEFLNENQDFLAKLFDFRKKMEMDRPVYKNGITSSRYIEELQAVQVVVPDTGAFKSKVVRNTPGFIGIERPDSSALPPNFSWKHRNIMLYFWRKNDAAYCMETRVADEVLASSPPLLRIYHSDRLLRSQNRKSPRAMTHSAATLYIIGDGAVTAKPAVTPGIKCHLVNISDSGCCLAAEGLVSIGMRVIVRFSIDETPLSINGVVRGINHDTAKNTSLLHIEADITPINVKNKIFSVLFNMLDDRVDDVLHENYDGKMLEVCESPYASGLPVEISSEISTEISEDSAVNGRFVDYGEGTAGETARHQSLKI